MNDFQPRGQAWHLGILKISGSKGEFLRIAGGSTLIMFGGAGGTLFNRAGTGDKPRSNYKLYSKENIGGLQLKNRLVRAATATAATTADCTFLSAGVDMHRNWSKGGAGLIMAEHMTVAPIPEGTLVFGHRVTCIYDDDSIDQVTKIADTVQNAGSDCKVVAQINHIGMSSTIYPIAPGSSQREDNWLVYSAYLIDRGYVGGIKGRPAIQNAMPD